jgi:hypothetical protein
MTIRATTPRKKSKGEAFGLDMGRILPHLNEENPHNAIMRYLCAISQVRPSDLLKVSKE